MKNEEIRFSNGTIKMVDDDNEILSVKDMAQSCAIKLFRDFREICKDDSYDRDKIINLEIKVTNALANVAQLTKTENRLF